MCNIVHLETPLQMKHLNQASVSKWGISASVLLICQYSLLALPRTNKVDVERIYLSPFVVVYVNVNFSKLAKFNALRAYDFFILFNLFICYLFDELNLENFNIFRFWHLFYINESNESTNNQSKQSYCDDRFHPSLSEKRRIWAHIHMILTEKKYFLAV